MMELRSINSELRATSGLKLEGYAALFDSQFDCGGFTETIQRGAFTSVLSDDVRCLANHNPSQLLGRTRSGTLHIEQDSTGLRYMVDLPNTPTGNEVWASVKRGDLSGSSFAFTCGEQKWSSDRSERTIISLERLYDVGPVTYPAYESTSVTARHLDRRYSSIGVCRQPFGQGNSWELERARLMLEIARYK